jgi:hypothetical protein
MMMVSPSSFSLGSAPPVSVDHPYYFRRAIQFAAASRPFDKRRQTPQKEHSNHHHLDHSEEGDDSDHGNDDDDHDHGTDDDDHDDSNDDTVTIDGDEWGMMMKSAMEFGENVIFGGIAAPETAEEKHDDSYSEESIVLLSDHDFQPPLKTRVFARPVTPFPTITRMLKNTR